jgi:hypothetical protein
MTRSTHKCPSWVAHLGWIVGLATLGGTILGAVRMGEPVESALIVSSHSSQIVSLVVSVNENKDLVGVVEAHGLRLVRAVPALNAALVEGSDATILARLQADARVRSASLNVRFDVAGACCGGQVAALDHEDFKAAAAKVDATFGALRARTTGRDSSLVALLDTGVDSTHPDLAPALVPGRSFVDGAWNEDTHGHGTAMASLVAARPAKRCEGGEPEGLEGVAPGVKLLSVRVADRHGQATLADVAAGVVYAADRGAGVILMSLGSIVPAAVLDDAVAYAEARGSVVVAAAGNRNVNVDLWPAAHQDVISVASTKDSGDLALATAFAPTTDLLAPGVGALSALPRGGYGQVGGSSAAAARVAGALALARELRSDLTPAQLRALVRGARRPFAPLAEQADAARVFRAGPIDVAALVRGLDQRDVAPVVLADARVLPRAARAGEAVTVSVRVENRGARPTPAGQVTVTVAGRAAGTLSFGALTAGTEQVAAATITAPATGEVRFALGATSIACTLAPAELPVRDLAVADLLATWQADGSLELAATIEGRGALADGAQVTCKVGPVKLENRLVESLRPGATSKLVWRLSPAQVRELPAKIVSAQVALLGREGDADQAQDDVELDLLAPVPGVEKTVQTQYQQSGDLNVIFDAPWRCAPGRPYVPVQLFLPEKGDLDPATWVRFDRVTLAIRQSASAAGTTTTVFEDVHGAQVTRAPAGTQVCDDEGQVQPSLRIFNHQDLDLPGRSTVIRLPRDAFGVASTPAADEARFVVARAEWSSRRKFLFVFSRTATGTSEKVLRVGFPKAPRASLSSEGRYFDAHVHTMAEWYQDDSFSLLAPRKAWGGPIPMLKEVALSLGLTDALDATQGRVVTTDHNCYYNSQNADKDALKNRPPFGPTSLASSGGKGEFERMGELFGATRGEEISFSAPQNIVAFLNLPIGAHILSYRAGHFEGPWHGGSGFARTLGDTAKNVELTDIIEQLTRQNRAENRRAAFFGAHPYSGSNMWKPENFDEAFELDPTKRDDRSVHVEGDAFVSKGMQVWNGEFGRHVLPTSQIDWEKQNPWADASFVRGNPDWDGDLVKATGEWHGMLAKLMAFETKARPGIRFPRKVFINAGTDAHGDFNMTEDRMATIVGLKSTFSVDGNAFGKVLTYALGEGKPGATADARAFEGLVDGNSVLTDGPLVRFSVDAEDRFDGASLRWTEAAAVASDMDGRIGGGGTFDGQGTALVRRGSTHVRLSYRHASTSEGGGDVKRLAILRTSVNDANPNTKKKNGAPTLGERGSLAVGPAGQDASEALNEAEEGLVTTTTALQLYGYTANTIDDLGAEGGRCLTNPVYAVPFDVKVDVGQTEVDAQGNGSIPAGALKVRFDFDMSMTRKAYAVEIKALDATGASHDKAIGPIDTLAPAAGDGWSDNGPVKDCRFEVTNTAAIPVNLDRFPSATQVTFVVYFYEAPQDAFGNELNRPATTFDVLGVGTGGGTGPSAPRATAASRPGMASSGKRGGGGGGGGGCALTATTSTGAPATPLAALALTFVALVALRRRAR